MLFDSHVAILLEAGVALVNATTPGHDGTDEVAPPTGRALQDAVRTAISREDYRPAAPPATAVALADVAADVRAVYVAADAGDLDAAAGAGQRPPRPHRGPSAAHPHRDGVGPALPRSRTDRRARVGRRTRRRPRPGAGQRPERAAGRLRGRAVRPCLHRHLPQRGPSLLLHALPEPRQGRRPPTPRALGRRHNRSPPRRCRRLTGGGLGSEAHSVVQALTAPDPTRNTAVTSRARRTHRRRAEPRHRRGARPGLRDPPLQRRRPRRAAPRDRRRRRDPGALRHQGRRRGPRRRARSRSSPAPASASTTSTSRPPPRPASWSSTRRPPTSSAPPSSPSR